MGTFNQKMNLPINKNDLNDSFNLNIYINRLIIKFKTISN